MDETDLVVAAQRRDERAFTTLVRRHERSLHATACAILGVGWDASDAVQSSIAIAWAKLPTLREPAAFGAWITRVLVNQCNSTLRGRRNEVLTADPTEPAQPDAYDIAGPEDRLDLVAAVRALDPDQREVVALRYFRDLKVDEIARILDCPVGTVKSRINRSIAKLASLLGEGTRKEASR